MTTMTRTAWGLDLVADDQVWRQRASCGPSVADWFWPKEHGRGGYKLTAENEAALTLCRQCPVRRECHDYETANPSPYARIAGGRVFGTTTVARSAVRAPYRKRGAL